MDTLLYKQLKDLDFGIAQAYGKAMETSSPKGLDKHHVQAIFTQVIDGKKISRNEAEALRKILESVKIQAEAREFLIDKLKENMDALRRAAGTVLKGKGLNSVLAALGPDYAGFVSFKSPINGFRYDPSHYLVIRKLIQEYDILVLEVTGGGIHRIEGIADASYSGSRDCIIYYRELGKGLPGMIVHEATHAVQDWRDQRAELAYIEADAYIAQAMVVHGAGLRAPKESKASKHPLAYAYHRIVKKGGSESAISENAYEGLADVIRGHPIYVAKAGKTRNYRESGGGGYEREVFKQVLKSLKKEG